MISTCTAAFQEASKAQVNINDVGVPASFPDYRLKKALHRKTEEILSAPSLLSL